jgi:hypothetical protein
MGGGACQKYWEPLSVRFYIFRELFIVNSAFKLCVIIREQHYTFRPNWPPSCIYGVGLKEPAVVITLFWFFYFDSENF